MGRFTVQVRKLLKERKREEALKLLIEETQNSRGAERQILVRHIKVISKLFFTNSTFQIYQDGLNLMVGKKFGAAKEKLEKVISAEPDNVEILTRLGQCLFLDNDPKAAVHYFKTASKLSPFSPEIRLWLGRALYLQGKVQDSIPELRSGFLELPASENAPVWLAEALQSAGQSVSALRTLDHDTKLHPFHLPSLLASARLRVQVPRPEVQALWAARKDLQLAMSRMDQYFAQDVGQSEGAFQVNLRKSPEDLKAEIQKLFQQIQGRLDQRQGQRANTG
jgi:tetratricopeptide (TPR) repeat protein